MRGRPGGRDPRRGVDRRQRRPGERGSLEAPRPLDRRGAAPVSERLARFERSYRVAIASAVALGRDTTICTIYNGNIPAPEAAVARVALMTFNDVILRVAFERGLRIIDLRLVCTEPADYANPIEPSGPGGLKIARAIARAVGAVSGPTSTAQVHVGGG
jgi:hypothetical protein